MSKRKHDISRRQFLEGSGAAIAVATVAPALTGPLSATDLPVTEGVSPGVPSTAIRLVVNGAEHRLEVEDRWTLAELLRDHLGLTGTKISPEFAFKIPSRRDSFLTLEILFSLSDPAV